MSTQQARTHVVLPAQLVAEIDALVGARRRSRFIAQAAEQRLQQERQTRALEAGLGAWKDEDHPELKGGSYAWVRKLRQESEARFKKQFRNR